MKFSIIIPVYNVAPYLRECLRSVIVASDELEAINDKWSTEIICIDDCSTDGSGEILDELSAVYHSSLVVYHSPANAGVSSARNRGLDIAVGDWIGFLDADDLVEHNWLTDVAQAIEENPQIDVVRTGLTRWIGEARKPFCQVDQPHQLWGLVAYAGFAVLQFVRRDFLGDVRYRLGIRMREDALFQYEIALKNPVFAVIDSCAYICRERAGSATYISRKRDDSYRLLKAYGEIWTRQRDVEKRSRIVASTGWVTKDIREWYSRCKDRSIGDHFRVWGAVWCLVCNNGVSPLCGETVFDCIRLTIYLLTGFWGVLSLNRMTFRRN